MDIRSKSDAQQRVDQIRAFQAEISQLEAEGIVALDGSLRQSVEDYHQKLVRELEATYDVDASHRDKQLSWGMKIASFIGALGLGASVFFLFYRFWGNFSTAAQVAVLVLAPVLGVLATMLVSEREKTGYFSKLLATVSLACFVLNLSVLGIIFNINPSENAFLVWALFAFLLAYASDARLLLAFGIISLAAFISARTGVWYGCYWLDFGERPENFFPAAAAIFLISLAPHRRYSGFGPIYRVFAMLLFFLPVLVLANWGSLSYLGLHNDSIEVLYQLAGFILSASAIWLGIRRGWAEVVNTGNAFFVLFLYTKIYQWWWDAMPKYLFFLIIGLVSILFLLVFKRLRKATYEGGLPV